MIPFADDEASNRCIGRIEALTHLEARASLEACLAQNAHPDRALLNLERWLASTSSPRVYLEQILGLPTLGNLLMKVLGASQPLADALIQNPELSSLVLEPGELSRRPTREALVEEGRRLIGSATTTTHALDRMRFLRQRWIVPIVINDLASAWPQEVVWRALSDLADAIVLLSLEVVWADARKRKDLPERCPLMVAAFGKLAGHELNYSSDIDLVYVLEDGTDETLERECVRVCEALGRAMTDRMGRGALYRVDLRLRPYGGAGPILRSMRSVEGYYQLYAEAWETQALLRSRPIVGPAELQARWEAMREERCFRQRLSEPALEQMLDMRRRIEGIAEGDDLKRGSGGIRDVEFLTQVLQMLHGHADASLRVRPTHDALRALDDAGLINHATATTLREGYTFLRKLEHRIQLIADQQTHAVPTDPILREEVSRTMGLADWPELEAALARHRTAVGALYRSTFDLEGASEGDRAKALMAFGPLAPAAAQWFDILPGSAEFYAQLCENAQSLERVATLLEQAPALCGAMRDSVALTEAVLSGEIEEPFDVARRLWRMRIDAEPSQVAKALVSAWTQACARWTLTPDFDLTGTLAELQDALLVHVRERFGGKFDLIALGSYGCHELGVGSDADVVLLVRDVLDQPEGEKSAQSFLGFLGQLRLHGAKVEVDLRLRPEGRKGLLVRSYAGFQSYELDDMEMWERFALGHARLVSGNEDAVHLVLRAAYGRPLVPEALDELLAMKHRIETERVQVPQVRRHVKLGYGGLNDIEWLLHLHEMRHPTVARKATTSRTPDRIRQLGQAGLFNFFEVDILLSAHRHLLDLRNRLTLLGLEGDIVPENPDKLRVLAKGMGFDDGNALLKRHEEVIEGVRGLYREGIERLRQ